MRKSEDGEDLIPILKALANESRVQILRWLQHPEAEFPPQRDGDLVVDGVCGDFIRDKLGMAASTTSRHLNVLVDAGLLIATRKKGWTFYRRDDAAIERFVAEAGRSL